jgi:uncharacterized protein YndB with AHSA1/START domain
MAKTIIVAPPDQQHILISREFAASREFLFRAHTEPDLLVQWLGPRDLTMTIDRLEVRDGGRWRYTHRDADGNEHGFRGVFHGDPSPAGIVQTFEYEGMPGHVSLETLTFEAGNGTTVIRSNSVYQSVEDRDAMIASGMESGLNEGYDRLDELIARASAATT